MANEAGFVEGELVKDTGFNSSPVTKGVLLRFRKPKDAQTKLANISSNPTER